MTATQSPAEFLASSPKGLTGSSPWAARYAADIKRAWMEFAAEDARTVQRHLGPSELGVECDRQVAGKLAGIPATNHVVDPWPSIRGRALHTFAEDVFSADNARRGLLRWITEQKVTPGSAAFPAFLEHPGTADLYDAVERVVPDHKFLGETSMAKIRKGWPRKYLVQLFLYGLGYWLLGLPVRRVAVLAYPATAASLDGLFVRDADFSDEDGQILPEVVELLERVAGETVRRKEYAARIESGVMQLMDVPAAPDGDECFFCPFYRPQAAKDSGAGCPGTVTGN